MEEKSVSQSRRYIVVVDVNVITEVTTIGCGKVRRGKLVNCSWFKYSNKKDVKGSFRRYVPKDLWSSFLFLGGTPLGDIFVWKQDEVAISYINLIKIFREEMPVIVLQFVVGNRV